MSIGIRHSITSGQCRAARALLDITQPELAEAAGLGLSTIVDFEKSRRDVSRAAVHAMQKALEKAGIQFIGKKWWGTRGPVAKIIALERPCPQTSVEPRAAYAESAHGRLTTRPTMGIVLQVWYQ